MAVGASSEEWEGTTRSRDRRARIRTRPTLSSRLTSGSSSSSSSSRCRRRSRRGYWRGGGSSVVAGEREETRPCFRNTFGFLSLLSFSLAPSPQPHLPTRFPTSVSRFFRLAFVPPRPLPRPSSPPFPSLIPARVPAPNSRLYLHIFPHRSSHFSVLVTTLTRI